MNSLFDKHFKRSLERVFGAFSDPNAEIITRTGTAPARVIIDTEYSVNDFNMQTPRTVACISRDEVPNSPHPCTIKLSDGRKFKSDGFFVGKEYATDEYEWCLAVIEVK